MTARRAADADTLLVRREARRVGFATALATAAVVLAFIIAGVLVIVSRLRGGSLWRENHEVHVAFGAADLIETGVLLGVLVIVLAGVLGALSARRSLKPLADALGRQRRFVADASHELRTPVAVLDTRLQLLERSLSPDDPRRATAAALREDSRRLSAIITDMLDSVEEGLDRGQPEATGTDVSAALQRLGPALDVLARERSVRLDVRPAQSGASVPMSASRLERVLTALVDNATAQSPPESTVTVSARVLRDRVILAVADEGPGIRGIDPDRVFDRFARSAPAADGGGDTHRGFGIGLSLVQDAATRAGGHASVARTGPEGTTFEVELPRL